MTRRGAVEVGFVLLAFYSFLLAIATVPLMFYGGGRWTRSWFIDSLKAALPILLMAAAGWALIAWRRELSARFFAEEDAAGEAPGSADWQDGGYRFGFAMLGVYTLIRWVPGAFVSFMMLLDSLRASSSRIFPTSPFERMESFHWRGLFASAATLAVGVYLLLGAPGLRQWLMKRARGDGEPQGSQLPGDEDAQPSGADGE